MTFYERAGKRAVDVLLASTALAACAPLMAGIAVLIKLDSPGPVLFRQPRSGRYGEIFEIAKFRSMVADNDVYDSSTADRVTRVGRLLRKTSLDELPQLWNVVRGDMTLIGPRPWIPEYYTAMTPRQRERYAVRPGLTGLAQASGRNSLTIFEKIEYDLEYVHSISFKQDLGIVARTLRTLRDEESLLIGKDGIELEIEQLRAHNWDGPSGQAALGPSVVAADASLTPQEKPKVVIGVTTDHAVPYHRDLAKAFRDDGWDVTFVSSGGSNLEGISKDVKTVQLRMERQPSPVRDLWALSSWLKLLANERPDLVIAGTPKAGMLGVLAAWITRVPNRVYWLHGLRLETAAGKAQWVLKVVEKVVIALATDTVAVSESLKRRVVDLEIANSKNISVVGPGSTQGVDTAKFAPVSMAIKRERARVWGLNPEVPTVGFVGRLTKDKGVVELCNALLRLHESGTSVQLLAVGPIEGVESANALDMLRSDGVNVVTPGLVDDPQHAFQAMDIFCLPSYREGLPNVILEAFACGVPVVATRVTGNIDLVEDGVTGLLVPPRSVNGLAEAFSELLQNGYKRNQLGRNGNLTANKHFDRQVVTELQLEYLKSLVAGER